LTSSPTSSTSYMGLTALCTLGLIVVLCCLCAYVCSYACMRNLLASPYWRYHYTYAMPDSPYVYLVFLLFFSMWLHYSFQTNTIYALSMTTNVCSFCMTCSAVSVLALLGFLPQVPLQPGLSSSTIFGVLWYWDIFSITWVFLSTLASSVWSLVTIAYVGDAFALVSGQPPRSWYSLRCLRAVYTGLLYWMYAIITPTHQWTSSNRLQGMPGVIVDNCPA
ncbi:nsp2TF protein, partial [Kibale red colobus virus 1]